MVRPKLRLVVPKAVSEIGIVLLVPVSIGGALSTAIASSTCRDAVTLRRHARTSEVAALLVPASSSGGWTYNQAS